VGGVKVRVSRQIEGDLKNATVTRKAGRWAVSLQTEQEVPEPEPRTSSAIGLDLGVASFATLSDGTRIHPDPERAAAMKRAEKTLAWEQRKLSRKYRKGPKSQNYRKQKRRVARAHERVANMRLDFLHKTSTMIGENQAEVYVEGVMDEGKNPPSYGKEFFLDNRVCEKYNSGLSSF
jgi:putative transposase